MRPRRFPHLTLFSAHDTIKRPKAVHKNPQVTDSIQTYKHDLFANTILICSAQSLSNILIKPLQFQLWQTQRRPPSRAVLVVVRPLSKTDHPIAGPDRSLKVDVIVSGGVVRAPVIPDGDIECLWIVGVLVPLEAHLDVVVLVDEGVEVFDGAVGLFFGEALDTASEAAVDKDAGGGG